MYERHFGLAGPPFRLSPDPEFLFTGDDLRELFAAMRQIFLQPQPILVVSGELGSGKTTFLRHWLAACRAQDVAVAELANTQLDPGELMHAIAMQFGATRAGDAPADAAARLKRHFAEMTHRGALLAIDESQNLSRDALASLAYVSQLALEARAALRICLTGQPELRVHLADPTLVDLRARIQRMCHLGALSAAQTRAYIEHRLLKVGWVGVPSFDLAALDEIHRFTEGVPRRINVLANRLLLSQMLSGSTRIDAPSVVTVARALRAEIAHERPGAARRAVHAGTPRGDRGVVMVVASGRSDHVKAVPLLHAIQARADLPVPLLVSAAGCEAWRLNCALHEFVGLSIEPVVLCAEANASLNDASSRFEDLLESHRPRAVIVFDGNAVSQCCALICAEHDVPLVHVGSDAQGADERLDASSPRAAIARIADLRFSCQPTAQESRPGIAAATVDLGNPLIDAVRLALELEAHDPAAFDQDTNMAGAFEPKRRGYGLVALKAWDEGVAPARSREWLSLLREVSRDLPLVWPVRRAAASRHGLVRALQGCQVSCVDELGHAGFVNLLRDATCVLTDGLDVIEEAAALHVPVISLGAHHVGQAADGGWLNDAEAGSSTARVTRAVWQIVFNGGGEVGLPPRWDGHAAPRIADFLAEWLSQRKTREAPQRIAVGEPPG